jgi:hypothetical protein
MRSTKITYFAAGAVATLLLGSGTAVAASGSNFLTGRGNFASTVTGLTTTKGIALSLKSPTGTPALKVSNTEKIPNLNADQVDGLGGEALARTAGQTRAFTFEGVAVDSDDNGETDTIVAAAECPTGSKATGGGHSDFTTSGYTVLAEPSSAPDDSFLVVVAVDESVPEDPTDVTATVVCYNPLGAVPDVTAPTPGQMRNALPAATRHQLAKRAVAAKR